MYRDDERDYREMRGEDRGVRGDGRGASRDLKFQRYIKAISSSHF